jgi:hypothetical protein
VVGAVVGAVEGVVLGMVEGVVKGVVLGVVVLLLGEAPVEGVVVKGVVVKWVFLVLCCTTQSHYRKWKTELLTVESTCATATK